MEEILASIRRILADGQDLSNGARAEDGEPGEAEFRARRDKFEATAGPTGPDTWQFRSDARGSEPGPWATPQSAASGRRNGAALASAATESSVAEAFQALVASRFLQRSDVVADLTREMIRPMLEAWIDANLPALVERLVAAEIARITRGE